MPEKLTARRLSPAALIAPCGMNCSLCSQRILPGLRAQMALITRLVGTFDAANAVFKTPCYPQRPSAAYRRGFPPSPDGGRSGSGAGDFSSPAPPRGGSGMANGPSRWWTASRSTANLGNGWAILNAGFGAALSRIIVTPESKTLQASDLFQESEPPKGRPTAAG
jgi:hypothetical protein